MDQTNQIDQKACKPIIELQKKRIFSSLSPNISFKTVLKFFIVFGLVHLEV